MCGVLVPGTVSGQQLGDWAKHRAIVNFIAIRDGVAQFSACLNTHAYLARAG